VVNEYYEYLNFRITCIFFFKTQYPIQESTNTRRPISPPTCGARLKPEQAMYGLSPPKLAPEEIKLETFGAANSKIPNQPLSQPQMGSETYVLNTQ